MGFFGKLSKYYMYIMTTGRNPAVAGKPQSQQKLRPRNTQETLSQDSGIYNTVSSINAQVPLSQESGIYNTLSSNTYQHNYTSLSGNPPGSLSCCTLPVCVRYKLLYSDSCIQSRTNRLLVHYIKGTELLYFVEDVICLLN